MNGFITKSTFDSMSTDAKFGVLYDLHISNQKILKETFVQHGQRIETQCHKIEKLYNEITSVKTGWRSITIPGVFGTVGGFIFFCGKWLIGQ